jgi:dTDP-4-dehydrorhamnose 3,5-epimerase-like enzyme
MDTPKIIKLPTKDSVLTIAENDNLPFTVKRIFWLDSIHAGEIRGEHAHRTSQQLLICLNGSLTIDLEDTSHKIYTFKLSTANEALYMPPMHWGKITYLKPSTVLSVASDAYDETDYIRDYQVFKSVDLQPRAEPPRHEFG